MARKENFTELIPTAQKLSSHGERRRPRAASDNVYRLNLKLSGDLKDYLAEASWRQRKSITQLVNDVLEAYKEKNPLPEGDLK